MEITELTELKPDGIYVLKVSASPDYVAAVREHLETVQKEIGCKFMLISEDMELLDAAELREIVNRMVSEALAEPSALG